MSEEAFLSIHNYDNYPKFMWSR